MKVACIVQCKLHIRNCSLALGAFCHFFLAKHAPKAGCEIVKLIGTQMATRNCTELSSCQTTDDDVHDFINRELLTTMSEALPPDASNEKHNSLKRSSSCSNITRTPLRRSCSLPSVLLRHPGNAPSHFPREDGHASSFATFTKLRGEIREKKSGKLLKKMRREKRKLQNYMEKCCQKFKAAAAATAAKEELKAADNAVSEAKEESTAAVAAAKEEEEAFLKKETKISFFTKLIFRLAMFFGLMKKEKIKNEKRKKLEKKLKDVS